MTDRGRRRRRVPRSEVRAGTYRGTAEGALIEFRIERAADDRLLTVSGDIHRSDEFIASFVCTEPRDDGAGSVVGPVAFRGHPELFTGTLRLDSDGRGIGSFQLAVDLEGGYRDVFAGRLDWQGTFLRRLEIEIDGIEGTRAPLGYKLEDGSRMTVARAFEAAGFDVTVRVDSFQGRGPDDRTMRGWSLAEIHAAMQELRSPPPVDRLHAHLFVCGHLAGEPGVLGIMYDFGETDLNRRPREGVAVFYDHPMLSDPRVPPSVRRREYVFTVVHELGHALNLLHSFDKGRPSALSWMNYPDLFPRGYENEPGHDGSSEFWRQFKLSFDGEELRHLHHATPREIRAGGFPFGTYEEGASYPFGGAAEPRRTQPGANPLRSTRDVSLEVRALKTTYDMGEPVFVSIGVTNRSGAPVDVPEALDPTDGYVRLTIRRPGGTTMRYRPPVKRCKQAAMLRLDPASDDDGSSFAFDGAPIFLSAEGPVFNEPGVYRVVAELTGVDGSRVVFSPPTRITVRPPDRETEVFARELFDRRGALRALYLRHPLSARDDWNEVKEVAARTVGKQPGNTTLSYFNYVSALGWLTPFADARGRHVREPDMDEALSQLSRVDPTDLPRGVKRRREDFLARKEEIGKAVVRGMPIVDRPIERARLGTSPAGLFGLTGLGEPVKDVATSALPMARVVPKLRGTRAFADVVSWNIEHLHDKKRWVDMPYIAEMIRSCRCDFWGLQEVDEASLRELCRTVNSTGRTQYAYLVAGQTGQQSGALYRKDTTTVRQLPVDRTIFGGKLKVTASGNKTKELAVFHRDPLLLEVRVSQGAGKVFDFRCAVVHLKSTDSSLKDSGNALRLAAAKKLGKWIETDRTQGERDYMVMGDMNAETAQQGLAPFTEENDLKLLSVGMQAKYGSDLALTRVASRRFLDHIVITSEAQALMPKVDVEEQLVVRVDTELESWTKRYSDHVPVAVRLVLGKDGD